jgi:hypothetical protein
VGEADTLAAGVRDNDVVIVTEAVLVTDGDACADVSDDADVDAVTNTLDDDVTLIDVVTDGSPLTLDVSEYDTEGVTENDTLLESVNELDAVDVMLAAGLSLTDTLPVLVNVTVIEIDAVPVTLLLPDMDADADGVLDDVIDTVGESVPVDVGVAVFVVDGVFKMVNDGVAVALDVAVCVVDAVFDMVSDMDGSCDGDMLLLSATVNDTVGLAVAVAVDVSDTQPVLDAVALAEFDKDIGLIDAVLDSDEDAVGVLDELVELPKEVENETDAVLDLEAETLAV